MSRLRREDGSSFVAVVLVMFIVLVLGATSVQLAQHNNDASAMNRERFQAVESAEAGVADAMRRIEAGQVTCDGNAVPALASPADELKDAGRVVGTYRTQITPEAGDPTCSSRKRIIKSWGYAPTGANRSFRHLEVQVDVVPQAGFPFTLFAEGTNGIVIVKNTGTIGGSIYAESLDQTQNNIDSESVITPGSIDTKNGAVYSGTLWAGGNVTLREGGRVGKSIIASGTTSPLPGNVVLENGVVVAQDVKAKGSISLPTTYTIGGAVSPNNPNLPAPPNLVKPTYTGPGTCTAPTCSQGTASSITTLLQGARNNLSGTFYSTSTGSSTVVMPRDVTVTGNLTIVSEGKVDMGKTMTASGGPYQVVIVSKCTGCNATDLGDAIEITSPGLTSAPSLDLLLWTTGTVDIKNSLSMKGAVYADKIEIKNSATVTRSDSLMLNPPVGFDFNLSSASQFAVVPTLWREVVPAPPPT